MNQATGTSSLRLTNEPDLPLGIVESKTISLPAIHGPRAIEDDAFPFESLSEIAEIESWRKEINRPLYHIHKWWARRLGTVFRAMTIGAFASKGSDLLDLFYQPLRIANAVVFDPFMGSGTAVGEAAKLGAGVIGRDINPVAHFLVKNALSIHDRREVLREFQAVENDVADQIRRYYRASLPDGTQVDVLYFFWVKTVDCPKCGKDVDLFSSHVFARHASPKSHPQAHAICPHCNAVQQTRYDASDARCACCKKEFNPRLGNVQGRNATCTSCSHEFAIVDVVRKSGRIPSHRLYAKLVLTPDGKKVYLPATDDDLRLYAMAENELAEISDAFPIVPIKPGHNTNQVLGYNYRYWHEMFNARQLLCLSILASRIQEITSPARRDLLTCLFSGTLEFNNMFTSYKGEGTGAVRHMFAHHILKPERVPIEANLWGTPKSSGSFSTMFAGRIRRALDYAEHPFELRPGNGRKVGEKVFGLSEKIGFPLAADHRDFAAGKRVYLSCGDSSETDIPDRSVDAILTDPPFFDNVHYSQLADFFHVWQRHVLGADGLREARTTRSPLEVQSSDAETFAKRLGDVLAEAHRVLKDDGILAFTYHHSRADGWRSVLGAVMTAGFGITATHPIKAEMSVAMPKRQAKEPIDLDVIVVCRKRSTIRMHRWNGDLLNSVVPVVTKQVDRFRNVGRHLSRNDVRVIFMAQLLRQLSVSPAVETALNLLEASSKDIENHIDRLHAVATCMKTANLD